MENTTNTITLRGTLESLPEYSHDNHGNRFYRFFLLIPRLSGTVDRLPVVTPESVLNSFDLSGGSKLTVKGQIRSHNQRNGGVRHLLIFVFATSVDCEDGPPLNDVILEGTLCKDPIYRRTPLGRDICDCMLAVPRAFRRADYLPCILWGRIAHEVSGCRMRDHLRIYGRLQSRNYTKLTDSGSEPRTAYEISALTAEIVKNDQ